MAQPAGCDVSGLVRLVGLIVVCCGIYAIGYGRGLSSSLKHDQAQLELECAGSSPPVDYLQLGNTSEIEIRAVDAVPRCPAGYSCVGTDVDYQLLPDREVEQ